MPSPGRTLSDMKMTKPYAVLSPEGGKHTLQCLTCGVKVHGEKARDANKKFRVHPCHPNKKATTRENSSQAAARIVREATECN